jgi:hypothetical protein
MTDFQFHYGHLGTWLRKESGWRNAYLAVDMAEGYGLLVNDEDAEFLRNYRSEGSAPYIDKSDWEKIHGDDGLTARATAHLQKLTSAGVEFRWNDNQLELVSVHGSPEGGVKGEG